MILLGLRPPGPALRVFGLCYLRCGKGPHRWKGRRAGERALRYNSVISCCFNKLFPRIPSGAAFLVVQFGPGGPPHPSRPGS